jgi:hypothetical protein
MAQLTMTLNGVVRLNPADDFVANTTFEMPTKDGYVVENILNLAGAEGVALADRSSEIPPPSRSPASSASSPDRRTASRSAPAETAPGSLSLPRSDREVARTEDVSIENRGRGDRSGFRRPVSLDLPSSPSRSSRVDEPRDPWEATKGNRFRRGGLVRE